MSDSVIKPKDLNPRYLKKIEDKYGPIDTKNDFFNSDLSTYYKTANIESEEEGGGVGHRVIKLPSFETLYNSLETAKDSAQEIGIHKDMRSDTDFKIHIDKTKDVFNKFRTYFRKNYPDQYNMVAGKISETIKETSMSSGGMGYNTPYAFLKPGSKPKDSQYTSIGYTPVNQKALRKKSKGVDYIDLYKT